MLCAQVHAWLGALIIICFPRIATPKTKMTTRMEMKMRRMRRRILQEMSQSLHC